MGGKVVKLFRCVQNTPLTLLFILKTYAILMMLPLYFPYLKDDRRISLS